VRESAAFRNVDIVEQLLSSSSNLSVSNIEEVVKDTANVIEYPIMVASQSSYSNAISLHLHCREESGGQGAKDAGSRELLLKNGANKSASQQAAIEFQEVPDIAKFSPPEQSVTIVNHHRGESSKRRKRDLGEVDELCMCSCEKRYDNTSMSNCRGTDCHNRINRTCVPNDWKCFNCRQLK